MKEKRKARIDKNKRIKILVLKHKLDQSMKLALLD